MNEKTNFLFDGMKNRYNETHFIKKLKCSELLSISNINLNNFVEVMSLLFAVLSF